MPEYEGLQANVPSALRFELHTLASRLSLNMLSNTSILGHLYRVPNPSDNVPPLSKSQSKAPELES